jgi:hypothetical protein
MQTYNNNSILKVNYSSLFTNHNGQLLFNINNKHRLIFLKLQQSSGTGSKQ